MTGKATQRDLTGGFTAADDGLHAPSDSFYDNETFWYSFFIPEWRIGAWLYAAVRQHPGVTAGGMWLWDDTAAVAHDVLFYEQFAHLKAPGNRGPTAMMFPTGLSIRVREPLMSYELGYEDRDRVSVRLRFDAVEPPVPLLRGARPYPKASHFDQIGHITGTVTLDGKQYEVDSYAMRDRSWGPRTERGYRRVGYTWLGSRDLSVLTYTAPEGDRDEVYTGYVRRGDNLRRAVGGTRQVQRDPTHGYLTAVDLTVTDESGATLAAHGTALSRIFLPHSTSICIATALEWTVDAETVFGEDQDVWPTKEWRARPRG
jgi:hypothetical protein